jgi:hypothetical protein
VGTWINAKFVNDGIQIWHRFQFNNLHLTRSGRKSQRFNYAT